MEEALASVEVRTGETIMMGQRMRSVGLAILCAASTLSFAQQATTSLPVAATPGAQEAKAASHPKIKVPKAERFRDMKTVYQSSTQAPHILMILHLPPGGQGEVFIEVYNRTKTQLGIFQFTLAALGDEGEIEFEDLPAGWSAVKSVKLSSLKELRIRTPRAIDKDANDVAPQLLVHVIDQTGQKFQIGKRQN